MNLLNLIDLFPQAQSALFIPGAVGPLEAIVEPPARREESTTIGIICHPHPMYGGTMNNKVVTSIVRAFRELAAWSLRFNYRGVGNSMGSYGEGIGETEDLLAILRWVREHFPGYRIWLAGFSFGCYVAMNALSQTSADYLITIAPAVNHMDFSPIAAVSIPWLLIIGDQDEVVPLNQVIEWAQELTTPPQLVVLSGAGHFFHGRLLELREEIKEVLGSR